MHFTILKHGRALPCFKMVKYIPSFPKLKKRQGAADEKKGPFFIISYFSVSEHENPAEGNVALQPNQTVHPTYVQYVDSAGEPNIYATNNGQM